LSPSDLSGSAVASVVRPSFVLQGEPIRRRNFSPMMAGIQNPPSEKQNLNVFSGEEGMSFY